ncbi:hypothetical protein GJ496_010220 [Pomphorhynchus laevis]|nr:hypothetical protein GJ496_010220 [Pomphorhynchus laevis]
MPSKLTLLARASSAFRRSIQCDNPCINTKGLINLNGSSTRVLSSKISTKQKQIANIKDKHCSECVSLLANSNVSSAEHDLLPSSTVEDQNKCRLSNNLIKEVNRCDQPEWFTSARNYFELFGIDPPTYHISLSALKKRYLQLSFDSHPDRNSHHNYERYHSTSNSNADIDGLDCTQAITIVTEGYRCLRNPFDRAIHLLKVQGFKLSDRDVLAKQPNPDFLLAIMDINESAENTKSMHHIKEIIKELRFQRDEYLDRVAKAFDENTQKHVLIDGDLLSKIKFIERTIINCEKYKNDKEAIKK